MWMEFPRLGWDVANVQKLVGEGSVIALLAEARADPQAQHTATIKWKDTSFHLGKSA